MSFPTFTDAEQKVDAFLALLDSMGIQVASGSQSEADAMAMVDVLEVWRGNKAPPADPRPTMRAALGFVDLAGKVVSVADKPSFEQLRPHLEMISKGSVVQNRPSTVLDAVSNKMIELYVACLAMKQCSNVTLDDPNSSKGDNPDVMFDFRGTRWALALKALHSLQPQTIFDNITKGSNQIEASNAQHGLVVLNVKNVLDHNKLWPMPNTPVLEDLAKAAIIDQITAIARSLDIFSAEKWIEILGPQRKAKPPVLFLGQSAFIANPAHQGATPYFMPLKILQAYCVPEGDPVGAMKLAQALNHEMQMFT